MPMAKLLWLEYPEAGKWSLQQPGHVFQHLQHLADHQMLAIVINRLDDIGSISKKDYDNATHSNLDHTAKIVMKTLCV